MLLSQYFWAQGFPINNHKKSASDVINLRGHRMAVVTTVNKMSCYNATSLGVKKNCPFLYLLHFGGHLVSFLLHGG